MYTSTDAMVTVKSVMPLKPTHSRPRSAWVASPETVAVSGLRLGRRKHREDDSNDDEQYRSKTFERVHRNSSLSPIPALWTARGRLRFKRTPTVGSGL